MAWSLRKPVSGSGWTIETVLEYINARIADMELRNQQRFEAQVAASDTRNADMELRQQQRFEAQTRAIEAAITAQRAAIDAALVSADRATSKAEIASEARFRSVNEFRQTLSDQASQFITRKEAEALIARNSERVQEITVRLQDFVPRDVVMSEYDRVTTQVQALSDRVTRSEGKGSGLQAGWGYIVAGIGLIATIIAIYIAIRG